MDEDELYADLPDDPELAFLRLEAYFRADCEAKIRDAHQDERVDIFHVEYIGRVLAAIDELGLSAKFDNRVPSISDVTYTTYLDFNKEVEHYRTALRIRNAKRAKGYSVRLNSETREEIRDYIGKIRAIVGKLEISDKKKDALSKRLDAFESEIGQSRTRYELFAGLIVEFAGTLGDAAKQTEPVRRWLDSIAQLIWGAKQEETAQLPAPEERKRLEPPRAPNGRAADDEIPF